MAKVERITVALSQDTLSAVRDAVGNGEYTSTSEVIRDALRDWRLKRRLAHMELDEMRRLVQQGAESGPGIDADLVFARLRAKYAAMVVNQPKFDIDLPERPLLLWGDMQLRLNGYFKQVAA